MHPDLHEEHEYVYRPEGLYKKTSAYVGISFAVHLGLLFFLLFLPSSDDTGGRMDRMETMNVRLVSLSPDLPSPGADDGAYGGATVAEEPDDAFDAVNAEADAVADLEETAPVLLKSGVARRPEISEDTLVLPAELQASEPSVKRAASSRSGQRVQQDRVVRPEDLRAQEQRQRVADTVRRLEEETSGDNRQASVRRRVEELEGETARQQARPRGRGGTGAAGSGEAGSQGGGMSSEAFTRLQIYQAEVRSVLRNNWVFSEQIAGDTRGLESRVVMTIRQDGEITDVWFEKRSGNEYLDESAYRTVMKSDPLPPLPDGMPQYHLMVGFTPGGLQ